MVVEVVLAVLTVMVVLEDLVVEDATTALLEELQ